MSWSPEMRQHRMRNYRLMFRGALLCLAISVVMTLVGGLRALVDSEAEWLAYGLWMFVWSAGSLYLTVDSTVRIIEVETEEARPRSEY
jgi:hypothetical protein